ncbi:MAG: hypothetical protein KDA57_13925 [Planctomycetales bacterium]|nr:hypothetical protein [Planctomycetales bacterium]
MLTDRQLKHLRHLQKVLKQVTPDAYKHSQVLQLSCGTPCCAFGYAAHHKIGGLSIVRDDNGPFFNVDVLEFANYYDAASNIFGRNAWRQIFDANTYPVPDSDVTPAMVVARIEFFITEHELCQGDKP